MNLCQEHYELHQIEGFCFENYENAKRRFTIDALLALFILLGVIIFYYFAFHYNAMTVLPSNIWAIESFGWPKNEVIMENKNKIRE